MTYSLWMTTPSRLDRINQRVFKKTFTYLGYYISIRISTFHSHDFNKKRSDQNVCHVRIISSF